MGDLEFLFDLYKLDPTELRTKRPCSTLPERAWMVYGSNLLLIRKVC
jgi:hypothetical protein